MEKKDYNIFTINLGSTSTKVALFKNEELVFQKSVPVDPEILANTKEILDQYEPRTKSVINFLNENNIDISTFDIIVTRGTGSVPNIQLGAYKVTPYLTDLIKYNTFKEQHISKVSCLVGLAIGEPYNIPVIFYDAAVANTIYDYAKMTGLPEITYVANAHVLNSRKVARVTAEKMGKKYEECNFIVCHMGGGGSCTAHCNGVIVDTIRDDIGPMSPERAGRVPTKKLVTECYSGKYTHGEMIKRLKGKGGIFAHLGTNDMKEAMDRALAGDEHALQITKAMAYQTAKAIGELACVLKGKVDALVFTGSIAYNKDFVNWIREYVDWIAPSEIVPGEMEMEALATGGLRVLQGLEEAVEYNEDPAGFASREEFYEKLAAGELKSLYK